MKYTSNKRLKSALKSLLLHYLGEVEKANEFLLSDPEDKSKYRSVQGYSDNVVNPGMESTFTFISHVMKALKAMHENIQVSFHK